MGYDPIVSFEPPKDEPTSPQPCPPGPIPMSYIPNSSQQPLNDEKIDEQNSSQDQNVSSDNVDSNYTQTGTNIEPGEGNGQSSRKASAEQNSKEGVHIVPQPNAIRIGPRTLQTARTSSSLRSTVPSRRACPGT